MTDIFLHLRHVILYLYHTGLNVIVSSLNETITLSIARSCPTDGDHVCAHLEANGRQTTRQFGDLLNITKSIIQQHLRKLSYVSHYYVCVLHNLLNRIGDTLLKGSNKRTIFENIGDW